MKKINQIQTNIFRNPSKLSYKELCIEIKCKLSPFSTCVRKSELDGLALLPK